MEQLSPDSTVQCIDAIACPHVTDMNMLFLGLYVSPVNYLRHTILTTENESISSKDSVLELNRHEAARFGPTEVEFEEKSKEILAV